MRLDVLERTSGQRQTVTTTADRWGRYPIRATVEVVAHGGLLTGTGTVDAADVTVFPMTPPQATALPQTELLDRLGTHLTRHIGSGVEYADIRTYVPGDQLRSVNWPVSARRGRLHVTQRLTDRSADVVVLIDSYPQPAGPATESTERTVRGAAQVVQTALRNGDRAGIIALGGRRPRWLGADIGQRQFYRVLDTVLAAGDEFETTDWNVGAACGHPARRDRRCIFHAARYRIRAVADRSAQTRARRGGGRRAAGRTLRGPAGPAGGPDVGIAAVRDVSRHGHRWGRCGGVADGSHSGPVDARRARSPPAGNGTPIMRPGRQLAASILSAACGLVMVGAVGLGSHGQALIAATSALAAVMAAVVFRPVATLAVVLTVVVIALSDPAATLAAVSGLSATVYLVLRHAAVAAPGSTTSAEQRWSQPWDSPSPAWSPTAFPLQLPWLPLLAPLAAFAVYLLATRPFLRN